MELQVADFYIFKSDVAVRITGHLTRLDDRKSKVFGELSDGSTTDTVKFIYKGDFDKSPDSIKRLRQAQPGASVTLCGTVVDAPAKATQKTELLVVDAHVHSDVRNPETYQFGLKAHKKLTPEEMTQHMATLRADPYTRFRDRTFQAIMRIRSRCYSSLVKHLSKKDFIKIDSPILTTSDCEGAGECFTVTTLPPGQTDYKMDFFGRQMYLTVSGQLEVEAAARELCTGVYTFGRTFRAEHSRTSRHLAEFEMLEPEKVFTACCAEQRFMDLLKLEEELIKGVVIDILKSSLSDLTYLDTTFDKTQVTALKKIAESPFSKVTYTKAIDILKQATEDGVKFEDMDIHWGMDLRSEHERYLCEKVYDGPLFVTHYPQSLKSFYMKQTLDIDEDKAAKGTTCHAVDLLVPGIGELCGGSMREDSAEKLEAMMAKKGMDTVSESLQWYVDLRRDGGMTTGGFGLGFARFVAWITGVSHVKDVVPFPRSY